ncbi:hypothetical protein POTOM_026644 [Populus tomentosa]|uniref:Major facilitator superfamily (MFS) profile domain-containing protein n=1 Tax=Populus tomentosa TaxID=118781 RepID=A0A8X7ZBC9_POPTO|nr:hypothetical protein POTOM_026644 [Populus tomentosa]
MSGLSTQKMADGGPRYSVDEALVTVGFGKFQLLVLLYAGMGWVSEAMEVMILSFVGPAVHSKWGLTSHEESLITTVVFAGMLVGAYTWGIIMPRLGWRWLLALSALPSFLLLVFYTLTPESPRYLCLKGRKNEALNILKKIAKLNGKELPPGVVVAGNEIELQGNNHLPESKDKDVC